MARKPRRIFSSPHPEVLGRSLLQALRWFRRPVSGKVLAAELGVSMRTLYRDSATLQAQGAAIAGWINPSRSD